MLTDLLKEVIILVASLHCGCCRSDMSPWRAMSFLETVSVTRVSDTQKYLEMELYQITFNLGFLFKSLCVSVLYQVCL